MGSRWCIRKRQMQSRGQRAEGYRLDRSWSYRAERHERPWGANGLTTARRLAAHTCCILTWLQTVQPQIHNCWQDSFGHHTDKALSGHGALIQEVDHVSARMNNCGPLDANTAAIVVSDKHLWRCSRDNDVVMNTTPIWRRGGAGHHGHCWGAYTVGSLLDLWGLSWL